MNPRPLCAATALGLLLLAMSIGNPFLRCPPPSTLDQAMPTPAGVVPLVQSAGWSPSGALAVTPEVPPAVPDPDGVGACPESGLPLVVRRGRDSDGWDTWWHADGSITKRGSREIAGAVVPFVMRMTPGKEQLRAAPVTADSGVEVLAK